MIVLLILICCGLYISAQNKPARKQDPRGQPDKIQTSLATLDALQCQREELTQQLELINNSLDNAPPEKERLKWLKERTRVYSQLASVEIKINKLIR